MFENLLAHLKVGSVELPNRICFLGHRTNFGQRGQLNKRHIAYYRQRAKGGCGLIIVGEICIHPNDRPAETMIDGFIPEVVGDYQKLTTAIHDHGTLAFAQLNHHGFQSCGLISRHAVWGPSAVADLTFGETAKPMEPEDIVELIEAFARSAVFAKEGGFDGVEIDVGPESLLRQFLSTLSNHRQDQYGGDLENRMRLTLEVIDAVRKSVGSDFPVGVRLCADEMLPWGGINLEESKQVAEKLAGTGQVDFIDVCVASIYNLHLVLGSMHTDLGSTIAHAEQIKQSAKNLPVFVGYQIMTPQMAEEVISKHQADAVGFVRPLICDPDFPQKVRDQKPEEIRICVRDNQGCIGRTNQSKVLSCIQNPDVGNESAEDTREKASKKKTVMVVGAGPAGLEAARAAKERGHDVTVYEKGAQIGGQVNLIVQQPGRGAMKAVVTHLEHLLKKLEVPIVTGVEVTLEMVKEKNPDAVIIATGSKPHPKPIPGEYGPPEVLNVWEAIAGEHPIGEKVLFVDEKGSHHATATAELLGSQGKKVTMITTDDFNGLEVGPLGDLGLTRTRLIANGVTFKPNYFTDEIHGKKVKVTNMFNNEQTELTEFDTIVLDVGSMTESQLYEQLKGHVKELFRAGDCVAARGIDMAVMEGRKVGEAL
jgi:mycofactocin system FadH/OYE family oxidoreductase 2